MNFIEKLHKAAESNHSNLCIGLDPNPELMPVNDVIAFNRNIIDATSDLVCAYKPNLAFYEALGVDGLRALDETLAHIPQEIPTIGDAKRGDIGSTSKAYAKALFETLNFDATTVNPYLGYDSIAPFIDYANKGVFILCKTSNQGSADFQDLYFVEDETATGKRPLFELVALKAAEWNTNGNIGLVIGATYPQQLKKVRELCPELPLLIPGIGAQGGDISEVIKNASGPRKSMLIINSSRQILYSSSEKDFAVAARKEAILIRDQINHFMTIE